MAYPKSLTKKANTHGKGQVVLRLRDVMEHVGTRRPLSRKERMEIDNPKYEHKYESGKSATICNRSNICQ